MIHADLAVIILTYNEEENIGQALSSVAGWAREVIILDSFSKDDTLTICRRFPCRIFEHKFENYSKQRNWALDQIPIESAWILFLDADEWLTEELKREIQATLASHPIENGFNLKRRFYWMGSWIRRGYYPTHLLRLFRRGFGRCEDREINEHILVNGAVRGLDGDFIHEDRKHITDWIEKHNHYAKKEALELARDIEKGDNLRPRFFGDAAERNRWLRYRVYNHLPPFFRPLTYFFFIYILRGGFLDGKPALIYHFLHGLWYPFLIDLYHLEAQTLNNRSPSTARHDQLEPSGKL